MANTLLFRIFTLPMTYEFILTEDDFLTHQLYASSVSPQVKRTRRRTRLFVPIAYLVLAVFLFFVSKTVIFGWMFILASIAWYLFYPARQRNYYKKYYRNHVREHFSAVFNEPVRISFDGSHYYDSSHAAELKLSLSEFVEIIELQTVILIKCTTGLYLLISKTSINDMDKLIGELKQLASKLQIPYKQEPDWSWK